VTAERSVNDDDLHATADGRLPPERQAEVEAAIADSADATARVGFYRHLNAALHTGYDFMLSEPMPERLAARPRRRNWLAFARVAAAVAFLLTAGAAGGWLAHDMVPEYPPAARALADDAAEAHLVYASQVSHPVEVPATETEQLQAWLSKNLDHQVRVPDLSAIGYEFLGGRLLPSGRNMAGQLMYQNLAGNRVTLYFTPAVDQRDSAFRFIPVEGVSVYYWHDDDFAYALASEVTREQLKTICNEVYSKLNPHAGPVEW
jgi:anti-sigma factor RsiW